MTRFYFDFGPADGLESDRDGLDFNDLDAAIAAGLDALTQIATDAKTAPLELTLKVRDTRTIRAQMELSLKGPYLE